MFFNHTDIYNKIVDGVFYWFLGKISRKMLFFLFRKLSFSFWDSISIVISFFEIRFYSCIFFLVFHLYILFKICGFNLYAANVNCVKYFQLQLGVPSVILVERRLSTLSVHVYKLLLFRMQFITLTYSTQHTCETRVK